MISIPNPVCGKAYYKDGHTEPIHYASVSNNERFVEFDTPSGRYYYERRWVEELLCDQRTKILYRPEEHIFYKKEPIFEKRFIYGFVEDMLVDYAIIPVDIISIELYEKEKENGTCTM